MELLKGLFTFLLGVVMLFGAVAGFIVVMGLLWAIPTMLLWDWLMPELFGLQEITLWEAWGVNILTGILFKSKGSTSKDKKKKKGKEILKKEVILG